jgi:hypothetical protein
LPSNDEGDVSVDDADFDYDSIIDMGNIEDLIDALKKKKSIASVSNGILLVIVFFLVLFRAPLDPLGIHSDPKVKGRDLVI